MLTIALFIIILSTVVLMRCTLEMFMIAFAEQNLTENI